MKFTKYLKRKILKSTFKTKLQHKRTLGTDGISTDKFSKILDEEITIIKRKVKNHTYNILPYKEQLILKSRSSNPRLISIPTNRDKLVLSALQKFLSATFKDRVFDDSVGKSIYKVKQDIQSQKYDSFIKLDIKDFYPNIDHKILLEKVKQYIDDEEALYLLENAITQITISKGRRADKKNNTQIKGIPQGLSISNILASVYLNDLDVKYLMRKDLSYFRYVDDILILCNASDIETIKASICEDVQELMLEVHEFKSGSDKSISGVIHQDKFYFLGFEFHNNTVSVREKSVDKLRDRIIGVFYANKQNKDYDLYRELNLKITGCIYDGKEYGWLKFFRQIDDQTLLYSLDSFVKSQFARFNRTYEEKKIKKFTKTYFLLKNYDIDTLDKNSYIPKFDSSINRKTKDIILDTTDDIEFY
jgi:retron-type reverse transcriptase